MPRDQRLYMTFPIDMDEHPKIEMLSDSAFRTFFKMNGYSRRQRLDGRIPVVNAQRRWKSKDLRELCASHDERPLVYVEDEHYIIRSYADHQFTTDDETELHERKARAGAAGGRAKAAAVAGAKQQPKQNLAESESGLKLEIKTDVTHLPESGHLGDVAAFQIEISDVVAAKAKQAGIKDFAAVYRLLEITCGPISMAGAVDLVNAITGRAKGTVRDVDAYVATACRNTPDEVRFDYDRLDLAVAS